MYNIEIFTPKSKKKLQKVVKREARKKVFQPDEVASYNVHILASRFLYRSRDMRDLQCILSISYARSQSMASRPTFIYHLPDHSPVPKSL